MGRATMQAAVFKAPRTIEWARVALPEPGAGQVRVRLEGCGVCASNLPVWEGRPWFQYPLPPGAPGHEGWGWVDALGEGVKGWRVGDRVAVLSYNAYAEFDLTSADALIKLPPDLAGQPFPGEPLGCAMNILRRCAIEPGQTVAVVGAGFLGALLVGLASRQGARVIALSRRPAALAMARRFGAAELISSQGDLWAAVQQVMHLTGSHGCERVIEAAGLQSTLDLASPLVATGGKLVIAGYHQDGPRQVDMQSWNWRGIDVINAHERDPAVYRAGIEAAVRAVSEGLIDPSPLYTHQVTLEELPSAFEAMAVRPDGFMKALLLL